MCMKALGQHLIIELYDCDSSIINSVGLVEEYMVEAVNISGATILKSVFHEFSPHGVAGVVVISESHFSIHTWPEYSYCALDIFTCGDIIDSQKALQFLKEKMEAQNISVVEVNRGIHHLPLEKIKGQKEKQKN